VDLFAAGVGLLSGDAVAAPITIATATMPARKTPAILVRTMAPSPMIHIVAGVETPSLCNV
jgi:hypothetical protein